MGLSAVADAASAIERLYDVFVAEVLQDDRKVDYNLDVAILVDSATFSWDAIASDDEKKSLHSKAPGTIEKESPPAGANDQSYQLENVNISIPRGQLCAIVGPIGSGKSSLLQGLIGEMRRISGSITFGGSVSYCPQSAWIQVRPSVF